MPGSAYRIVLASAVVIGVVIALGRWWFGADVSSAVASGVGFAGIVLIPVTLYRWREKKRTSR